MVRAMFGVQQIGRKRGMGLMFGLSETIDRLAMVTSVRWYGHVMRMVMS